MLGFSFITAMLRLRPTDLDGLIGAAIYALDASTSSQVLVLFGAKFNPLIVKGEVWRLVMPIFLHVGLVHLAFNSYAIYAIAPQIERFFGSVRFLSIYLLSGAYGVFLSFLLNPGLSAGASGAIFGLIGTQAAFFYRYRDQFGSQGRRVFQNTLSVIFFNLVMTFTVPGIDIWGHMGGLVAGTIMGWYLMPRYAAVVTEEGPRLVDRSRSERYGFVVLVAFVLLVVGSALTILSRVAWA